MNVTSGTEAISHDHLSSIKGLADAPIKEDHEIKRVAQEFEAIFLKIVLKSMRDTVPDKGMINGGNGEDIFRSMLDEQYAKSMSEQGSTGIATAVERQLKGLVGMRVEAIDRIQGQKIYKSK